jgi:hypothetical protein
MNQLFGSSKTISEDVRLASLMEVLKLNKKQREEFVSLNNYGYLMPTIPWDITLRLDSAPDFPINIISEIRNNIGSTHLDQYGAVEEAYYSARELQSLSNIDVASLKTDLNRINKNHAKSLIAKGFLTAFSWSVLLKPYDREDINMLQEFSKTILELFNEV